MNATKKGKLPKSLVFLMVPGLLFALLGLPVLIFLEYKASAETDEKTSGTIITVTDTRYKNARGCSIKYADTEGQYFISEQCAKAAKVGDTIAVYYPSDSPEKGTIVSPGAAKLPLIIGMAAYGIFAGFIIFFIYRDRRRFYG